MTTNRFGLSVENPIHQALLLPNGARFYKCALQVNPFEYCSQHNKNNGFQDEASYNTALVDALLYEQIEVIAVTDHWRVKTSKSLLEAAQAAGIHVFPGFEATSSEGVHILCLFEKEADIDSVQACSHIIRGNGHNFTGAPLGSKSIADLNDEVKNHGGICIAAHMTNTGGLLKQLIGQARITAWRDSNLMAGCIPGAIEDLKQAQQDYYSIIMNKNPDYKRVRPMAIINSGDISGPSEVSDLGKWSYIKMANVSIEGLRQAFLDPISRIRLASEAIPDGHVELVAMSWEGGLLDGVNIHFNENLNVLVGGRGTGKSTMLESLRYVLDLSTLGDSAREAHRGMMREVLGNGAKVSLLIRFYRPGKLEYLIERTYPGPPIVRDETGNILQVAPKDVLPSVEVYGQHEIAELAHDPVKLTNLLHRFLPATHDSEQQKKSLRAELKASRQRLLNIEQELESIEQRLAQLPRLRETLRQYKSSNIEQKLIEQTRFQREEQIFATSEMRLEPINSVLADLRDLLPLDREFLSTRALKDLPNAKMLERLDAPFEHIEETLKNAIELVADSLLKAREQVAEIRQEWQPLRNAAQLILDQKLRELQKDKIDGTEFLKLQKEIDGLQPLEKQKQILLNEQAELEQARRNLLGEWESTLLSDFRALEQAAKRVSKKLDKRVRVRVEHQKERAALRALLDKALQPLGGQRSAIINILMESADLSLRTLAAACRGNVNELQTDFGLTANQAQKLANIGPDSCFQLEEVELNSTTQIDLNVASRGQNDEWRPLRSLSVGQRATAVLLLLLLESKTPLAVDQPEDDLDNRFIADDIVPIIKSEKLKRQFIFATHNANLPVLGDAELIVGLQVQQGQAEIFARGSLDTPEIHQLVEEVLEGGREAFETRRIKYDF